MKPDAQNLISFNYNLSPEVKNSLFKYLDLEHPSPNIIFVINYHQHINASFFFFVKKQSEL